MTFFQNNNAVRTEVTTNETSGAREISVEELDLIAGGWSSRGMLGAAVAGGLVGGVTGALAGGIGAAPGAVLGAVGGAVAYNIQGIFEQ